MNLNVPDTAVRIMTVTWSTPNQRIPMNPNRVLRTLAVLPTTIPTGMYGRLSAANQRIPMNPRRVLRTLAVLAAIIPTGTFAQVSAPLDSATLAAFPWRSVGPANMSGRVTDVEGIGSPSKTFYVATAAGGIWKTTNNGTTFRPLFTEERVISMGDLAIAPSDTNIIWAGTGEEDSRNSISPGGGIYKSTDGGMTWRLMGLEETQVIARIVVHPSNHNSCLPTPRYRPPWRTSVCSLSCWPSSSRREASSTAAARSIWG